MLLIGADEERGRERVEAALLRHPCRLEKAHLVALDAAARNVVRYSADKRPQAIVVAHEQRQADGLCVFLQAVAPGAVFGKGMDIRIVPIAGQVDAVGAERAYGHIRAGRAADVHEQLHNRSPLDVNPV